MHRDTLLRLFDRWNEGNAFSGVFSARTAAGPLIEAGHGFRNRAERLVNLPDTAIAVASVTKLFTSLCACRLLDEGRLSLDARVHDILPHDLGRIDRAVTAGHLLTHTSGIGDYIDEEAPDSEGAMLRLYARHPVYLWDDLSYYLPMFRTLAPKFAPGERFGYSNAGFALLGLVIEAAAGMPFRDAVRHTVLGPCGFARTGFYRMDSLPGNTALGYTRAGAGDTPRTNIFRVPAIGGADGGIFTCAADLDRLWRGLMDGRILSARMREAMLTPRVRASARRRDLFCGLGVFLFEKEDGFIPYAVGSDFGANCFTAWLPQAEMTVSALGNAEMDTWPLLMAVCEASG